MCSNLFEIQCYLSVYTSCVDAQRAVPLLCATMGHTSSCYVNLQGKKKTLPLSDS